MTPERFHRIVQVLGRRQPDLTVVMDGASNNHNLGAIARTGDAVGLGEVHTVNPVLWQRLGKKVTAGAHKHVRLHTHGSIEEAYQHLRGRGFRLLTAHLARGAVDYREMDYLQPTALVVGAEWVGLSPAALAGADGQITIPMEGMIRSLNVSVATALILYEAYRQRLAAGYYESRRLDDETYRRLLVEWGYPHVAARCRSAGVPYPELGPEGEFLTGDPPEEGPPE